MIVFAKTHEAAMDVGVDIRDVTPPIQEAVTASGVSTGTATVFCVGSTGSLTTIEYEPGVVEDLARAVNRMAPPGDDYAHEQAWHDGNGHSHVQAALLGPSVTIPVRGGRLVLGTWQQVVLINHDNRTRRRRIEITVTGIPAA
ncbi:MAG: secondary thiamine-phosphate synthase enzyme YjbQ [Desulfatibacillaceae bacterium]